MANWLERFRLLVVYGQPDPPSPGSRDFSSRSYGMAGPMDQQVPQPLGSTLYSTSKRNLGKR